MLILLASAAGSPGVTTTALGLGLNWPGDTVIVDADRNPSQAVLAGFLGGVNAGGRGLGGLARLHRERRSIERELLLHCLPLTSEEGEAGHRRLYLPGFNHPGSAALFTPVWQELAESLKQVESMGFTVIVDVGRLGEGVPAPLLGVADAVLLVTRTDLRALAAVRLHLPPLQQRLEQTSGSAQVGLLLVGEGQPYTGKEIGTQFGVPVWASIADDARSARVWSDGYPPPGKFQRSPLVRSVRAAISALQVRILPTSELYRP